MFLWFGLVVMGNEAGEGGRRAVVMGVAEVQSHSVNGAA